MIPLPPWLYAAGAAIALSGAFLAGWQVQGWRYEAKRADALEQAHKGFVEAVAKSNAIAAEYEADTATAREVAYDRQTEIRTIYRNVEVPASCAVPDAVAAILQSAVDDANAAAAGQPVAAVSPAP